MKYSVNETLGLSEQEKFREPELQQEQSYNNHFYNVHEQNLLLKNFKILTITFIWTYYKSPSRSCLLS